MVTRVQIPASVLAHLTGPPLVREGHQRATSMNDNPFDDDFMNRAQKTQRRMAVIGLFYSVFLFLLFCTTVYFFLAAAGVVPQHDVIPYVPYV